MPNAAVCVWPTKVLALISIAASLLSGCATPALIDKATRDTQLRVPITADHLLRVKSASYFDDDHVIGICVERTYRPTNQVERVLLQFPDPRYSTYKMLPGRAVAYYPNDDFIDKDGVLVATGYREPDRKRTCETPAMALPLIELTQDKPVTLPKDVDRAVVHFYRDGQLVTLGYAANIPFLDNRHSYAIDVTKTSAYYTDKVEKGNRALLLFIPFAAVVDAAGFVLIAPPVALRCMQEPDWCKD